MKSQTPITLAAALLLAGATAASAAGMAPATSHSTMARQASDTLSLTATQRRTAWNDLQRAAMAQKAPSSFKAKVGAVVPSTLKIEPIPSKAASAVPVLRSYDFARVRGKLLIVNPTDKKIAEVITG